MWGRELLVAGHFVGNIGGFDKWKHLKMEVYNGISYTNGWFRGTPILDTPIWIAIAQLTAQLARSRLAPRWADAFPPPSRAAVGGSAPCADATVAKHHIVLGRSGNGRPSRTLSTNKCVRVQQMCQGIWDVVIYHHLSHIWESNNDAYLKINSLLKWMKHGLMTSPIHTHNHTYIYIFISPWHIYHHKSYVMIPFQDSHVDGPAKSCTSGRWASVIPSSHPIVEVNPWRTPWMNKVIQR